MGVKELWTILSPVCDKKPLWELENKTIAIDLSAWIVDSQNVADNSQRNMYLRNLFFRTSYLLLLGTKPIFVLEGAAPKLKYDTIARRQNSQSNLIKKKWKPISSQHASETSEKHIEAIITSLNCENLLESLGLTCFKGKGEAEAYCAKLNQNQIVDGVISQDSDCFLYGAQVVFRNFTMSPSYTCDMYQLPIIQERLGLGRQKLLAISLLCGCDYESGVQGVGKESTLKFLTSVTEDEILKRLRNWRSNSAYYENLEKKKHLNQEQKLELSIRKKALLDPNFPSEDVISEFLDHQEESSPNFVWKCPNLQKFLHLAEKYLSWDDNYAIEKFTPLLTRWHLLNNGAECGLKLVNIIKKRVLRGIASYEIKWQSDETGEITTIEPQELVAKIYIDLHEAYVLSKQKPKKESKRIGKKAALSDVTNMQAMLQRLNLKEKKQPNKKRVVNQNVKSFQTLDKFLVKDFDKIKIKSPLSQSTPSKNVNQLETSCHYVESDKEDITSPLRKNKLKVDSFESCLSDCECNESVLDLSDIVYSIISKPSVIAQGNTQ